MNRTTTDERLARLEAASRRQGRILASLFLAVHGDRGYGSRMPGRFPCRDCNATGRLDDGIECPRCAGHGTLSLKGQATLDLWDLLGETEPESEFETRLAS